MKQGIPRHLEPRSTGWKVIDKGVYDFLPMGTPTPYTVIKQNMSLSEAIALSDSLNCDRHNERHKATIESEQEYEEQ